MQTTSNRMVHEKLPPAFASVADPLGDPHTNGEYLRKNPTWHVEHSAWKADNLFRLLQKRNVHPRTVCDVGCGAGEVLRQLHVKLGPECRSWGYDVAEDAIRMAKPREQERLQFQLADFTAIDTPPFDLLIMTEVVDHVEDYFRFLRALRGRAEWKLFSFSLDFSTESSMRPAVVSKWRGDLHHLHHFNKDIVMHLLAATGYDVVDYAYAPWWYQPPHLPGRLMKGLRGLVFAIDPDVAARLFIGYNLIVLAR